MLIDRLCLAENDSVLGKPTIDGFTGIEDAGILTTDADPGYGLGHRITYGNGSLFPPMVFQGVKERGADFLDLSFLVRFDLSFDAEDLIVIALREDAGSAVQDDHVRRIDIYPLVEGIGADVRRVVGPGEDPLADDTADANGQAIDPDWHIRGNRAVVNVEYRRGQAAGNPWTGNAIPTGIDIAVRSWQPPTLTTSSVGSQSLPTATFNVTTTAEFPESGAFVLPGNIVVRYAGKTATAFTGCSYSSPAQTIADGTTVSMPEYAWSLEIRLPRTMAQGGTDWIDLNDGFGLYFNVFRISRPTHTGSAFVVQYVFPYDDSNVQARWISNGDIGDDSQLMIDPAWYGRVGLPSLDAGTNCGQGVQFIGQSQNSVGSRSDATAWSALSNQIRARDSNNNLIPAYLVAQVENTSTSDAADGVRAELRFANWGLGAPHFFLWNSPDNLQTNPTGAQNIPTGGSIELVATWPAGAVPTDYQTHPHQCMWVQLSSNSAVNFTQASMRRNMDFIGLSKHGAPAYVSGKGYPPPSDGSGLHHFMLFVHVRKVVTRASHHGEDMSAVAARTAVVGAAETDKDMTHWIWIVTGYRRTGKTVTVKGTTFEILDDSPGAFGYVASHEGTSDVFTYQLSGGGIRHEGGNGYSLKVPDSGEVALNTRLEAGPPPQPGPDVRRLPWWVWLLLLLVLLLLLILAR